MKMKFMWKVLLRERHVLKAIDLSLKLLSVYYIRNDTSNRKFIVRGAMSVSLFCQLSGPLVEGEEYLDNMILTLNLQMAYMLSSDTAIAWVENQATAASILLKGELL